jgi:hypothetical protein
VRFTLAGVAQSVEQLICNQPVAGSSPIASSIFCQILAVNPGMVMMAAKTWQKERERFPSGQREQTVNLSANAFGGSNPPLSTIIFENDFQKIPLTFNAYA